MDKVEVKQRILEEITKTENDVKSLKELTKPISPENAIGRISRMDAINNKSINDASLIQSQDKLKKLITALEKIDNKNFGICIRCEKPIPLGRIMLMPHSTKCVNCT
jgi:DnaK suppressor protein